MTQFSHPELDKVRDTCLPAARKSLTNHICNHQPHTTIPATTTRTSEQISNTSQMLTDASVKAAEVVSSAPETKGTAPVVPICRCKITATSNTHRSAIAATVRSSSSRGWSLVEPGGALRQHPACTYERQQLLMNSRYAYGPSCSWRWCVVKSTRGRRVTYAWLRKTRSAGRAQTAGFSVGGSSGGQIQQEHPQVRNRPPSIMRTENFR